jgi:hypothetical protein
MPILDDDLVDRRVIPEPNASLQAIVAQSVDDMLGVGRSGEDTSIGLGYGWDAASLKKRDEVLNKKAGKGVAQKRVGRSEVLDESGDITGVGEVAAPVPGDA